MSQAAQSLVTSHKLAAKRATEYLQEARNLKLRPPEALELVARVLGAANWKTLLGMAEQGRAPEGLASSAPTPPSAEAAPEYHPDESERARLDSFYTALTDHRLQKLADYFSKTNGGDGEHPDFPEEDYQEKAKEGVEYWVWVLECMTERRDELPWDRDEMPEFIIANAAGITLNVTPENLWHLEGADEFMSDRFFDSEIQAWWYAAELVEQQARRGAGDVWDALSLVEKRTIIEQRYCQRKADGSVRYMNAIGFDMVDHERNVCSAAGMHPRFHPHPFDGPDSHTTTDGKSFTSEMAALAHQFKLVAQYVCAAQGWDVEKWNWMREDRHLILAKRHAAAGRALFPKE